MSVLYDAMKSVAAQYEQNQNPVRLLFATILQAEPLRVELDNKLILDEKYFLVAQHLTDYEIEAELTTDEIEEFFVEHEGRQDVQVDIGLQKGRIKLKNKLKSGDRVIVIALEGGQFFVILDRIGGEA